VIRIFCLDDVQSFSEISHLKSDASLIVEEFLKKRRSQQREFGRRVSELSFVLELSHSKFKSRETGRLKVQDHLLKTKLIVDVQVPEVDFKAGLDFSILIARECQGILEVPQSGRSSVILNRDRKQVYRL
jgi:hypothetical protein